MKQSSAVWRWHELSSFFFTKNHNLTCSDFLVLESQSYGEVVETFCKLTREVAPCFLELTLNCFYFLEMCWLLWMMKAMTKQAGADVMSALIKRGVQSPTYIPALSVELSWFYWTSRVLLHLSYFLHLGWTSLQTLQTSGIQLHKADKSIPNMEMVR